VVAECDASLPRGAARVTITLADGSTHQQYVEHPRGSAKRPLSDAELAAKYRANAALGGTTADFEGQITSLWALDQAASITPLMALLSSSARNAGA
jgi:2-methylcitrate dehydratase PrpD